MITRRQAASGAAAVLLAAGGGYFLFRPTDESRIRAQLDRLAAAVKITPADMQVNPIGRLAHVSGLFQDLFEPDVRVSVPELTSLGQGRSELAQLVTGAPRMVKSFEVSFGNVTIKLDEAHTSALVGAAAKVKAVDREGTNRADKRAVDFRFVNRDGSWIISTVTVWPPGEAAPE